MTANHDSAAFLRVVYSETRKGNCNRAGWYVQRTCACHEGELVSMPFDTSGSAERCLAALDEDSRRHPAAAA